MQTVLFALTILCLPAPMQPQAAAHQDEIRIESVLVVRPPIRAGRSPVFSDPVEHLLVRGEWRAPAEGDGDPAFGESQHATWRRIDADENGAFPPFSAGYAWAMIDIPESRIALLDARGHRHVYINGEPRVGDVYNLGYVRLPIQLRKGTNELLFRGGRGQFRASIAEPPAPVFIESRDPTLPDILTGSGEPHPLIAGIIVTNATAGFARDLTITARAGDIETSSELPPIPPLTIRKVPVQIKHAPQHSTGDMEVVLTLQDGERKLHTSTVSLTVRDPGETHRRTFISRIDGSVQYYAVTPMAPASEMPADERPALFLTLHGASVEGFNQARAYAPKDSGTIVAPTNRRPFGFDWEDWGRLDALEVLAMASDLFGSDPDRTYLTGHSMGGHGTWHLGVHHPDIFAAIAPSAGWPDFWSYSSAADWPEGDPVERILHRSMNASRTRLLDRNLQHSGVYVLHGDADDNVPVSQARMMRERLGGFHANFTYYERPGAGHWWGRECVDWPPLFDFLQDNRRPAAGDVSRVEFHTPNPGISSRCYWVVIQQQRVPLEISRIDAAITPRQRRITASTGNIARISFDLSPFSAGAQPALPSGGPLEIHIDDQKIEVDWPEQMLVVHLGRDDEGYWRQVPQIPPGHKGPHRAGMFKDAFRNAFMLVYGTRGTPEENAWAYAKARFDAETFWYRGNGAADILPDTAFDAAAEPDRNIVLYGNAETNLAWSAVLENPPFDVRAGLMRMGDRTLTGDNLAGLFIYPRAGSTTASVGVVAGAGIQGMRLTNQLPYFLSGVAYPDWIIIATEMLEQHTGGVRALGFFAPDWSLGDDHAWRDSID